MASKKSNPAMDFIIASLKKNKNASYADIQAAAQKKGHKIYPIMFGRAKALLGLVKVAPRGSGGRKKKAAKTGRGPGRPPGRPGRPRSAASLGDSIDAIIGSMRDMERERERYRAALEKIRGILEALA